MKVRMMCELYNMVTYIKEKMESTQHYSTCAPNTGEQIEPTQSSGTGT